MPKESGRGTGMHLIAHIWSLILIVTPWIEVPPPEIFFSLDRKIKVYPGEPQTLNVRLNSTSSLSKNIDLKLCQNNDCKPISSTTVSPPTNLVYLPVILDTNNIDPKKLYLQFFAYVSPTDVFTAPNFPNPKVWDLDVDVGDRWSEIWDSLKTIPPYMLLLLVSIVTFVGGIFINKQSLSSRFKKFMKSRRKRNMAKT